MKIIKEESFDGMVGDVSYEAIYQTEEDSCLGERSLKNLVIDYGEGLVQRTVITIAPCEGGIWRAKVQEMTTPTLPEIVFDIDTFSWFLDLQKLEEALKKNGVAETCMKIVRELKCQLCDLADSIF
jgi:methyl coenzyme M reductase beta subunit